jgi:hypothetical protein
LPATTFRTIEVNLDSCGVKEGEMPIGSGGGRRVRRTLERVEEDLDRWQVDIRLIEAIAKKVAFLVVGLGFVIGACAMIAWMCYAVFRTVVG